MARTKRVDNEKCKLPPVHNGRVVKKSPAKAGGSPAKAAVTARQPIPSETLLEALLYLDRGQLEAVQLSCPRFKAIVEEKMSGVCLRLIAEVRISMSGKQVDVELKSGTFRAFMSVDPAGQTQNAQPGASGSPEDAQGPLVPHLRNAVVLGRFMVGNCRLTPPFLDAFRGIVKNLRISGLGFLCVRDVWPASDVHQLLHAFSSISAFFFADPLNMDWRRQRVLHPVDGIDDALLRSCIARDVAVVNLPRVRCAVTEHAILEWSFASDTTNKGARYLELTTDHISERFLQRFVELHESSEDLNPMSLKISFEPRDFALNADWDVEESDEMLRIRRLMCPITHREDLKASRNRFIEQFRLLKRAMSWLVGSFIRLEVYHQYSEFWEPLWFGDMLVIRRGLDSPRMEEGFFGTIEQARLSSGPQDAVRFS